MSTIFRQPADYLFGTLSNAAATADTSISSAAFAGLGTQYSATLVLPIVLHNPALDLHEVVWATSHGAGSQFLTVIRGKEGTAAQAWPSGTQWICAPTAARDGLSVMASPNLPTDAHLGQQVALTDLGWVVEMTATAGWQPSVGIAKAIDIGLARGAVAPPVNSTPIVRAGQYTGTTNGGGQFTIPFTVPFPNGCINGLVSPAGGVVWTLSVVGENASGLTVEAWQFTNFTTAVPVGGQTIPVSYIAVGY